MNACERWNICPLGDITRYLGCRKAHCPTKTMADVPSPFITNQGARDE